MPAVETSAPRWAAPASTTLAVAGLAASAYLTVEHFAASETLACPATGGLDCQKVTTSEQAAVLGVPVAILGTVFFAALLIACLPPAWRSLNRTLRRGRVVLAAGGVAFVVYLVYAELFLVNAVCLWCTTVHILALGLFAVVAVATAAIEPPNRDQTRGGRAASARSPRDSSRGAGGPG